MTSSCSDESTKAPENFHVHNDEVCDDSLQSNGIKSVESTLPTRQCPLCDTQQCKFHCRNCIRSGSILHSSNKYGERYLYPSLAEKQTRYIFLQGNFKAANSKYEEYINNKKICENVKFEIKQKEEHLKLLQELIKKKRTKLTKKREEHKQLSKANEKQQKELPKYPNTVKKLSDYVLDRFEKIEKLREKHEHLLNKIQSCSRYGIQQLVENVFPIKELLLKGEHRSTTAESMTATKSEETNNIVAALEEAKNTSFIRGKWVIHGSGISEMQYSIVAPSLPANGDYSAYVDWVNENMDDLPKYNEIDTNPSKVNSYRITGALIYTTQLIQLMSYFLNIHLPCKLTYGEFCKFVYEKPFLRKVSRLNSNIMYLAYTQQVPLRDLVETHTLENVLAILDVTKSNLGRQGYHDVTNAPLVKSIDSLLIGIETATESDSDAEDHWEAVGDESHHSDMDNPIIISQSTHPSVVGDGLLSTAAKSITSIFRWMK